MRFDIITLFPEMFSAIKEEGVVARAIKKSIISINEWQLRDFSENKYKNVDDKAYGGGAGMVMQVKPIRDCIKKIKEQEPKTKVIYLSPQGEPLNQNLVEKLSSFESLTLLCGRYEGVDERIIKNDVDFYLDEKLYKSEFINFHPLINTATITIGVQSFINFMIENNKKIHIFSPEESLIIKKI